MTDFRSDRMPTAEGRGLARRAWDNYAKSVKDAARPLAANYAANKVDDLIGFWVMWHTFGGFEGLLELGYPRTTIYRKVSAFRRLFKYHPDEFVFDGVIVTPGKTSTSVRDAEGNLTQVSER
jgi:hypothetical protein